MWLFFCRDFPLKNPNSRNRDLIVLFEKLLDPTILQISNLLLSSLLSQSGMRAIFNYGQQSGWSPSFLFHFFLYKAWLHWVVMWVCHSSNLTWSHSNCKVAILLPLLVPAAKIARFTWTSCQMQAEVLREGFILLLTLTICQSWSQIWQGNSWQDRSLPFVSLDDSHLPKS